MGVATAARRPSLPTIAPNGPFARRSPLIRAGRPVRRAAVITIPGFSFTWQLVAAGQRAGPLAVALEEVAADDEPLDLVGALADDHERGVAVEPLGQTGGELPAHALDAHGFDRHFLRRLGGVELGHARLQV